MQAKTGRHSNWILQVGAIYPTAALLPHSCTPNTRAVYRRSGHKYFQDTTNHFAKGAQVFPRYCSTNQKHKITQISGWCYTRPQVVPRYNQSLCKHDDQTSTKDTITGWCYTQRPSSDAVKFFPWVDSGIRLSRSLSSQTVPLWSIWSKPTI